MEHPQTVLLSKVLQANIYLANAYVNQPDNAKIIVARWMNLQQSVNVLFDGKNAAGKCFNHIDSKYQPTFCLIRPL